MGNVAQAPGRRAGWERTRTREQGSPLVTSRTGAIEQEQTTGDHKRVTRICRQRAVGTSQRLGTPARTQQSRQRPAPDEPEPSRKPVTKGSGAQGGPCPRPSNSKGISSARDADPRTAQKGGLSGKSAEMPGGVHKGHEAVEDVARRYGSSTCRYRVGTLTTATGHWYVASDASVRVGGIIVSVLSPTVAATIDQLREPFNTYFEREPVRSGSLGRRHARVPVKTVSTDDGMIECFLSWWTKYPVQCGQAVTNTRARDEYSKKDRVMQRRPICGHGCSTAPVRPPALATALI